MRYSHGLPGDWRFACAVKPTVRFTHLSDGSIGKRHYVLAPTRRPVYSWRWAAGGMP